MTCSKLALALADAKTRLNAAEALADDKTAMLTNAVFKVQQHMLSSSSSVDARLETLPEVL